MHEEQPTPAYTLSGQPTSWSGPHRLKHSPAKLTQPLLDDPSVPDPDTPSEEEASRQPAGEQFDDWNLGRQDARIRAILRSMALGHLWLGFAVALAGVIMEAVFRQPAFFGLAASGGMLGACGLITLLAINRQSVNQSALGFYLLPYADFAIVGLWLLLFGAASTIALLYAYVLVSAALLIGSRHALALTLISGATVVTVGLGQFQRLVLPALTLPAEGQLAFNLVFTALGLGLMVYIAALFSNNLDRFIAENNRQIGQQAHTRAQITGQQAQIDRELEILNDACLRFSTGETHARVPVSQGTLAPVGQHLNSLFEQIDQLMRAAVLRARMEERIGELSQALERLSNGDSNAFQAISTPSGTSLDSLTVLLAQIVRQIAELQQAFQRARGDHSTIMNLAAELMLARQSLSSSGNAIHELLMRSAQSAVHLRAMIDNHVTPGEGHHAERPFLREMELRARQQGAGLELLHARVEHIEAQLEATEGELRRIAENGDPSLKAQRRPRGTLPISPSLEQLGLVPPGTAARQGSGPLSNDYLPPYPGSGPFPGASIPPRPGTGPFARSGSWSLKAADATPLPRRFVSPMMQPSGPDQSRSGGWFISPETSESEPKATP